MRKSTVSLAISLCLSAWNISAPTGRIFIKFGTSVFFENLPRKLKFHYRLTRTTGTLHEDLCTFMTIPLWILITIRSVSDRSCRENPNTHFKSAFFPPENHTFMRYCRKLGRARWVTDGSIIRRRKGANCHRITKTRIQTHTHMHARTHTLSFTHSVTQNINTNSFFTASMVTRTLLNVNVTHTSPVMFFVVLNYARNTFDSRKLNKSRAPLLPGPSAQPPLSFLLPDHVGPLCTQPAN